MSVEGCQNARKEEDSGPEGGELYGDIMPIPDPHAYTHVSSLAYIFGISADICPPQITTYYSNYILQQGE